jgi:PhoPQ-activated pathogenicity-related protein
MLSSNDEFMMNDWPQHYMDRIPGEKHVYVVPNTDHSLATGILKCLGSIGAFLRSMNSQDSIGRPTYDYHLDNSNGEITVTVPKG